MGSDYSSLPLSDDLDSLETKIDSLQSTLDTFDTKLSDISQPYRESDDTLIIVTDEHKTTSGSYVEKIDFLIPELIHDNSIFKVKFDAWANCNSNRLYVAGYLDDTQIFEKNLHSGSFYNTWTAKEETGVSGDWGSSSHFYIKIKSGRLCGNPYNNVGIRNFEICGLRTPFIEA